MISWQVLKSERGWLGHPRKEARYAGLPKPSSPGNTQLFSTRFGAQLLTPLVVSVNNIPNLYAKGTTCVTMKYSTLAGNLIVFLIIHVHSVATLNISGYRHSVSPIVFD